LWLLVVLVSLLAVFVIALSIPLDVALRIEVYGKPEYRLRLAWLFGLLHREFSALKKSRPAGKGAAKPGLEAGKGRKHAGQALKVLRIKGLPGRVLCLLPDLAGRLKIRDLSADFKFGLGDPADTGLLFAFLSPVSLFINSYSSKKVQLHPSFSGHAVMEGQACGEMRIVPLRFVPPLAGFCLSPPVLKAAGVMVSGKWKRRN